jgi:hypothetical protein
MDQLEPFTPVTLFGQSTPLVLVARGGPGILEFQVWPDLLRPTQGEYACPAAVIDRAEEPFERARVPVGERFEGISQQMVGEFVGGPTDQRGKLGEERLRIFSCDIGLAPLRSSCQGAHRTRRNWRSRKKVGRSPPLGCQSIDSAFSGGEGDHGGNPSRGDLSGVNRSTLGTSKLLVVVRTCVIRKSSKIEKWAKDRLREVF